MQLRGWDVEHVVASQYAGPAFHGFDVDGEVFRLGTDQEILSPILAVGSTERAGGAGKMVAVCEDDFAKRAREAHHARLREAVRVLVPDIGNVMMPNGVVNQLTGKKLLLVANGDLNIRAFVQNNLLHANLMASKVSTKPIKMTENGT